MPENKTDIGEGERLIRVKAKSRNTTSHCLLLLLLEKTLFLQSLVHEQVRSVSNSEIRG